MGGIKRKNVALPFSLIGWKQNEFGLWRVQEKMAKRELILVQSTTRMQHNHSLEWSAGGKFGGRHYLSPWKLETSLSLSFIK